MMSSVLRMCFIFFKQETAYELRISDWSSDVCSSDLKAQAMGMDARGPYSPDTIFIAARRGDFDAIVSMYHDQGQIAMKLIGFDHGVTLHGGLPVPVVTSASGSAFDIAGKGIANIEGLQQAFDLCTRMAGSRPAQDATA